MTTVVGFYQSLVDAQQTITDLVVSGFDRRAVSLIMGAERSLLADRAVSAAVVIDDGAGRAITCASGERRRVLVAGPLAGADEASFRGGAEWAVGDALRDAGLGPVAANGVVEAICAGAILVAVQCEDRRVRMARDILDSTVLPVQSLTNGRNEADAGSPGAAALPSIRKYSSGFASSGRM